VTVQVALFRAGAYAAVGGLNVLRFAERGLPDVVYLEQLAKPLYLDKGETVDHYLAVMERLCLEAAPAASLTKAINAILRDRCHGDRPGDDRRQAVQPGDRARWPVRRPCRDRSRRAARAAPSASRTA
jgi:Domain of unknown function (DUF5753)